MILGGLWHGSTWNFVIWGLIHGVALVVERLLPTEICTQSCDGLSPSMSSVLLGCFSELSLLAMRWTC